MEEFELTLVKSRLGWNEGILSRFNKKGGKIAEFSAKEIKSIYTIKKLDFGSVYLGICCGALTFVSYTEISHNLAKWVSVCFFGFFSLGAIMGLTQMRIVIETRNESLSVEVEDEEEDAQAFVHSLQKKIKEDKQFF